MGYIERAEIERFIKEHVMVRSYDIDLLPDADVAPVRHGRWIQCKYADKSAKCSECGGYYTRFTVNERYPKYCPNCGAMMDLED